MSQKTKSSFEKISVPAPVKLSLLWASLMALYIYNDYFLLFIPGTIQGMSAGSMGPLGEVTDIKLLVVASILALPASMIFLSSILPSGASRGLNLIIGPVYVVIAGLTFFMSPYPFFKFIVSVEIVATLLIIWIAVRWPRHAACAADS